jgi:hypothetical protein
MSEFPRHSISSTMADEDVEETSRPSVIKRFRLCPSCTTGIQSIRYPFCDDEARRGIEYERDSKEFRSAAEAGCLICGGLWDKLCTIHGKLLLKPQTLSISMEVEGPDFWVPTTSPEQLWLLCYLFTADSNFVDQHFSLRPFHGNT